MRRRSAELPLRPERGAPAPRGALLVVACLLLTLSAAPAAESLRVIRGPWWWHTPDGIPHVAVAVAGAVLVPPHGTIDDREIALTGRLAPLAGASDSADGVLVVHAPLGSAGELRFDVAGQPVVARLRRPVPVDSPARIAVTGGHTWPDHAGLQALGRVMGGAPQLVLVLGAGVPARLGTGGWEADVPIAVVAPEDPALRVCTDGADAAWRQGVRVGVLGLPAAMERSRADLAMARDLSPWLVYLDVPAGWDPAIGQRRLSDPQAIGVLLAGCQRLKVPLVLGDGTAGLISEPLAMNAAGHVDLAVGGVRYVLAAPAADDGLGQLPAEICLPLEQPLLTGLVATIDELHLELMRPGAVDAARLSWRRGENTDPETAADLLREVAAAETLESPAVRAAIARWTWLPRKALASAIPPVELIARLRDEGGAQGRILARRLALIAAESPTLGPVPGDPDPLVGRDRLLWKLATVRGPDAAGWRGEAAATTDPLVLRALFADLASDPERLVLPALVERVGLQAAGTLPLDADPIDQHKLCAAVFDDVHLSPTPLRPWAVILVGKVDALARGPIERFLKRHGDVRPVP